LATDDTKAKTNGVTLTNPVTPTNGALGSPGSPPTPNTAKPPSVAITPLNTASTTTTARPSAPGAVPEPPDSRAATAREVALVDAARAALRRGDGGGTLRLLGDYERLFHPAHLEPEVLYLRMQAAQQQGDRAGARRAATQILTEFPQSPEVGRAEELLQAETGSVKK